MYMNHTSMCINTKWELIIINTLISTNYITNLYHTNGDFYLSMILKSMLKKFALDNYN
jgi:hypothetical protein